MCDSSSCRVKEIRCEELDGEDALPYNFEFCGSAVSSRSGGALKCENSPCCNGKCTIQNVTAANRQNTGFCGTGLHTQATPDVSEILR